MAPKLQHALLGVVLVWLTASASTYILVVPRVPLDEWAWLVAGVIAVAIGSIAAGLTWMFAIVSIMPEMGPGGDFQ